MLQGKNKNNTTYYVSNSPEEIDNQRITTTGIVMYPPMSEDSPIINPVMRNIKDIHVRDLAFKKV